MARTDLTGDTIRLAFADDPSGKAFEAFFRRLLEAERGARHAPSLVIDGPAKAGVPEGGKDFTVVVKDVPRVARTAGDLTWDELGKTYYSLKSGSKWRKSILEDVGYGGTALTGRKSKNDDPRAPKGSDLVPHVASGGRFVVVTSEPTDGEAKTLDKIIRAFDHHMRANNLTPPSNWRDKIHILDANHLATFVRDRHVLLPQSLDQKLGLDWPEGLDRFEQWTRGLRPNRPAYVPDDERRQIIDTLHDEGRPRVIRVFGPPGVGKTRLVHYALEQAGDTDAVYHTQDINVGDRVVTSRWLERDAGAVTIVVDEVVSTGADSLARDFLAHAPQTAHLILLGVTDEDVRPGRDDRRGVLEVRLGDLASAATRELVEAELGSVASQREQQVSRVLELADGYPWFAILLARALALDEDALNSGTDEASRWAAAKRVLAGGVREHASDREWKKVAMDRALCLLVVIMTGDQDLAWDELWDRYGDELRGVIGDTYDWKRIKAAEADCVTREILRSVGSSHKRYVSPANLSRMILNHFLGDGPHDLGPRLLRHGAGFHARVCAQAERLDASRSVRDKLARALLTEIDRRRAANQSLDALLINLDPLYLVAERMPEAAADTLAATITAPDLERLAANQRLRHALRGVFQELVSARVSQRSFANLEGALFRMALVDDERWANNATGIWKSLFLVAASQTNQPWSFRFELLRARCTLGTDRERALAIEGLSGAVASVERGLGHAPGLEWPIPTMAEAIAAKREAWELLLDLCADPDAPVAAVARGVVAAQLRGCVADGAGVDPAWLSTLSEQVQRWTIHQRHALAETLTDIQRYEASDLDTDIRAALAELELRLNPVSFRERLVAQVGSWHPGPWPIDDLERPAHEQQADVDLVRHALAHPHELLAAWDYLESQDVHRRRPFLRTVGRLDTGRVFLPALETRAQTSTADNANHLLAWYIEGWTEADDQAAADEWLAHQLLGGGEHTDLAGFVLPFLEPSDRRLEWLIASIERGQGQLAELSVMFRRWVGRSSPALLLDLLDALVRRPEVAAIGVSIAHELLGTELPESLEVPALEAAGSILAAATSERLPMIFEYDWARLASSLTAAGRVDDVIAGLFGLMEAGDAPRLIQRVLAELLERGHALLIWQRFTQHLTEQQAFSIASHLGEASTLSHLEPEVILNWVQSHESRTTIATQMINPYSARLPAIARELLRHFGPEGPVASALAGRVRSTPRPVASLIEFQRRQLVNAECWADDELPEVRQWATTLAQRLRETIAEAEAHESFRRKLA